MDSGLINNRELASLLWFAGIGVWLVIRHRQSTVDAVCKLGGAFRPVLPHFALYAIWIGAVVGVASRLGFWNLGLLKATVLWALLSGIGLLAGTTDALKGRRWFWRAALSTIGATAVVEYFVNLRSFPLVVELVLQPVIFCALVLPVVARNPEDQPVRVVAGWTSALIGFAAIVWTGLGLSTQWSTLDLGQLLAEAVLPVWLTVGALGFLFPFTLYMAYEQLLKRMTWRAKGESIWRQRAAVVVYGGPRLSVVQALQGGNDYDVVHASGFVSALRAIRSVRERRRDERNAEQAAVQRLGDNAGLDGWDGDGRRLDEREFEETRNALRWLSTCHMGHYRNEGRYRHDLLPIVETHFARDGLPEDHGVVMVVARDGQSWYAYRRTVSDWYFAIGASGPPPGEWCYDGAEPPSMFPSEGSWSRFGVGNFSSQW